MDVRPRCNRSGVMGISGTCTPVASKIADAVTEGKKKFEEHIQADTDKQADAEIPKGIDTQESDVPESVETKNGITDFDEALESDTKR